MIVTCPNCASRFVLAAEALAPGGQKVRCTNCEEVWEQEPDEDELLENIDLPEEEIDQANNETPHDDSIDEDDGDIDPDTDLDPEETYDEQGDDDVETEGDEAGEDDDIPEAVKPLDERPLTRAQPQEPEEKPKRSLPKPLAEIILVLVIFTALCAPLFVFKSSIMRAWPNAIAFYDLLGMAGEPPGEGLVLDKLSANIEEQTLTITGQAINLTSSDVIMPLIEITLRDDHGEIKKHWYLEPSQTSLEAEQVLPIAAEYEIPKDIHANDVRIRFVIAKTASEDDDNTEAPHADDHADSHGDEEAAKSHQPADAHSHQESSH